MTIATDNAALAATRPAQAIRWRENAIVNRADERLRSIAPILTNPPILTARNVLVPVRRVLERKWVETVSDAYAELEAMGPLPAVVVTIRRDGAAVVVGIEEAS